MRSSLTHGRRRAQSIIETVVGIIFLVPIVLFLVDVGILVLGNTANDNLAKQAARAAAGAVDATKTGTPAVALVAAQAVVTKYAQNVGPSSFITTCNLDYLNYNNASVGVGSSSGQPLPGAAITSPGPGNVSVVTTVTVQCPVPFPGFNATRVFQAKAVEPIVALPP